MNLQSIGEIVSLVAQITTAAWILCSCLWLQSLSHRIKELEKSQELDFKKENEELKVKIQYLYGVHEHLVDGLRQNTKAYCQEIDELKNTIDELKNERQRE